MRRLLRALREAWTLAKTRRDLYALTERQLRDIGLRREQIEYLRRS